MPGSNGDFLVDTHALLFFWGEPRRLSKRALALLKAPEHRLFVSAASAWEIAAKVRIGKLPGGEPLVRDYVERLLATGFCELGITSAHALRAGSLAGAHRDPFDRMLAAQALTETLPIISQDEALEALGAELVW
jgi:PIN domain nuclease of toxin-antitoxin system